jgi:Bacterial alpha-L-rhamnosidase 6 hairpin glycosidase domain/Bacterial alpha-L-rhamnosidase C-terminal domain
VRSAFGSLSLAALSDASAWLHLDPSLSQRYSLSSATVRNALRAHNLVYNGTSEAYFVDGNVGPAKSHAAVHSTLYAIVTGAADGDAKLAQLLTRYLARHGVAPSSCMTGRWWVEALYRLGMDAPEAADLALTVLTAPNYPSWLDMLAQGATTTMEAWRPADKSNLDWAHPWCASPSFTIPKGVMGIMPLQPGFARFRLAPQPSFINSIDMSFPTPAGMLPLSWRSSIQGSAYNSTLIFSVLPLQAALVCLPIAGAASSFPVVSDTLFLDSVAVDGTKLGRMLCATGDVTAPGQHVISRITISQ